MKGVEHHNCGNKIFSTSFYDAMKSKVKVNKKSDDSKTNCIKDEQLKHEKEEDHVWPMMREDDPGFEWTDNDEIVEWNFSLHF